MSGCKCWLYAGSACSCSPEGGGEGGCWALRRRVPLHSSTWPLGNPPATPAGPLHPTTTPLLSACTIPLHAPLHVLALWMTPLCSAVRGLSNYMFHEAQRLAKEEVQKGHDKFDG